MSMFSELSTILQKAIHSISSGEYDELYIFSKEKYGKPETDEFVLVQNHTVSQIAEIIQKPHLDHSEIKYYDKEEEISTDDIDKILEDCQSFIPLSDIAMVLKKDNHYKKIKPFS